MIDNEKQNREPVSIRLSISDLFRQDQNGIHDLDAPVILEDISRKGLSFLSECIFPAGYFFNAALEITQSSTETVFTKVKIVHVEIVDCSHYRYSCIFTDLPAYAAALIDQFTPC